MAVAQGGTPSPSLSTTDLCEQSEERYPANMDSREAGDMSAARLMDWEKTLWLAFQQAKQTLQARYRLEDDGSGPPKIVAMRALIDKLPCPAKVVELRFDRTRHPHLRDDACPAIVYELSKLGDWKAITLGVIDAYDFSAVAQVLSEQCGLPPEEADYFARRLKDDTSLVWSLDTNHAPISVQLLFYDPRRDPGQFAMDLTMHLGDWLEAVLPATEATDYSALYSLQPNPIVPLSTLLEADTRTRNFARWTEHGLEPLTLEILQQRAARVLLIPPVPEPVHTLFARARDLYVFAFFRYEFFTVSRHQASLTLEAAIKHRYVMSLGDPVALQVKGESATVLLRSDYDGIWRIWRRNRRRGLIVNGAEFPASMNALMTWLVDSKIITRWERKICEYYIGVRNWLSHPTYAPIDLPGRSLATLQEVALLINKMFHAQVDSRRSN